MSPLDATLLLAVALANAVAFALMGADKVKARKGTQRVTERTLLLWCGLFGALGGWLGMQVFRHKTKHIKFTVTVPVLLLSQIALLTVYFVYWR